MVIYLDVMLLINILTNGSILLLVSYLAKQKTSNWRLIFGLAIATLIVPLIIYFPHSYINTFIGKIVYSFIIILITFGFQSFQRFIKILFLFYFVSFLLGGGLLGVNYFLNASSFHTSLLFSEGKNVPSQQMSLRLLLIGFPILVVFLKKIMDRFVIDNYIDKQFYTIRLAFNGYTAETTAFVDSGNHLIDPLTNRPVVVCDASFMKNFFTNNDWEKLKNVIKHVDTNYLPPHLAHCFTIIPYEAINGKSNLLIALRPDKLTIYAHKREISTRQVLIGIQLRSFTKEHNYHCLLHPNLILLKTAKTL